MIKEQKQNIKKIRVQQKIVAEIDYDRLADAIVKANEKQSQKHSVSREWMKFIIYPVFWGVSIVAGLLAGVTFGYGCVVLVSELGLIPDTDWMKCIVGFIALCIGFFLFAVCLVTAFTAKEIDKETDRQYVAAMFSNVVALAALVVALIALVKG